MCIVYLSDSLISYKHRSHISKRKNNLKLRLNSVHCLDKFKIQPGDREKKKLVEKAGLFLLRGKKDNRNSGKSPKSGIPNRCCMALNFVSSMKMTWKLELKYCMSFLGSIGSELQLIEATLSADTTIVS